MTRKEREASLGAEARSAKAAAERMSDSAARKMSDDLLRPLLRTSWRFYVLVAFLGAIVLTGLGTWMYQMWMGFGITGINNPIFWAFYITSSSGSASATPAR